MQGEQVESGTDQRGEPIDTRREGGLEPLGERQPPGTIRRPQHRAGGLRQFHQGERIALGDRQDPGLCRAAEVRRGGGEKPARLIGAERLQVEHTGGRAGEGIGPVVSGGGQQHDPVVLQAPRDEAEYADGRRIQPLEILGDHQERLPGGRVDEQVQGRHGHREGLRRRSGDNAEGNPQRLLPGRGDQVGQGKQRLKELVEPGHPQARLRRGTDGPQDPGGRSRPPHGVINERRLADAGRTPDQDGGTALPVIQVSRDHGSFGFPANEAATTGQRAARVP